MRCHWLIDLSGRNTGGGRFDNFRFALPPPALQAGDANQDLSFDQLDIIAALAPGRYLTGPYASLVANGQEGDSQTSIVYDANTGEVAVDAPAGIELTSINIDSAAGIFGSNPAANVGGSFDNDSDCNIFKATFGSSFGSIDFGHVAQTGLSEEFILNDLTVVGSLAGGGDLGNVDLMGPIPEPSSIALLILGLLGLVACGRRRGGRLNPTYAQSRPG